MFFMYTEQKHSKKQKNKNHLEPSFSLVYIQYSSAVAIALPTFINKIQEMYYYAVLLCYLANLRCIVQEFLGVKVLLVFDEIISQAAVGEIFHYQPQVPSSCREKDVKCDNNWRKYDV